MKRKFLSKLVLGVLISSTLVGSFTRVSYARSVESVQAVEMQQSTKESFDQMKNEVEKYLVLNEDGTIGLSPNIPSTYNEEYSLDGLLKHFEVINQKVLSGEISINKDFTINQAEVKAGSTYQKTHWWGNEFGYSYRDAVKEIANFRNISIGGSAVGIFVGIVMGILAGAVVGLVPAWCAMYANSMEAENNTNNQRGIVTNINWAAIYDVYSQ